MQTKNSKCNSFILIHYQPTALICFTKDTNRMVFIKSTLTDKEAFQSIATKRVKVAVGLSYKGVMETFLFLLTERGMSTSWDLGTSPKNFGLEMNFCIESQKDSTTYF